MSDRSLNVTVGAKDNASPVFRTIGNSAKTMGQAIEGAAKGASGAGGFKALLDNASRFEQEFNRAGQALTGFGVATTAAIGIGIKNFANLEQAMANVATIAGQSDAWLGQTTNQIRELAVELGTSPVGLAEGLYDLIGSGIAAADAMEVLEVAATAAKAGMTDTATATRAITAVLNAYGMEASEAGNVSDVLFSIVNEGVVTFEGLARNLQNVIPLSSALGVGMEEVGAAFKTLTLQGFSAATAETGIAGFMRAAIAPTEELTEAVRELTEYTSVEALVQAEGLSGLLRVIEEAAGGSTEAMATLMGTTEATTATLALLKDGADGFAASSADMFAGMQDGALTAEVAARQMDTLQGAMGRLQASAEVASGVFGEMFADIATAGLDAAATGIQGLTSAVQALPGPAQQAVVAISGIGGAAALAAGGMLLLAPRIVETRNALVTLGGLRGIFGMLGAAVGPLGLAIGSLGVGVLLVSENMRRATEDAKNYSASVEALTKTIEELKLAGEESRAAALGTLQAQVDSHVALLDNMENGALSFYDTLDLARQGIDPTTYSNILVEDFNRAIELADDVNIRIGETLSNPNIDDRAYNAEVQRLLDTITVTAEGSNIDEVFDEILALDITKFRDDAGEVASIWDSMLESVNVDPGDIFGSARQQIELARAASEEYRAEQEALRAEQQQMREEWIASALAVSGFDDALSLLNMSGAASDVSLFAEGWQTANEALDNTFRVIVGGTNAIIQQVDGIQSWADSLIGVRGELGLIDDLLAGGFIDEPQYAAAQTAYDQISESVGDIRNNLLAVQAIQAPFIAEAIAGTERWAAELRSMPEDVQRTTLAMMDQQTVAQTLELVNLASAESYKALGDQGRELWEATFMGAAQANPMLLETAEAFGFIKQSATGIEFNWDAILSGGDAITQLTTQVEHLVDTLRQIHGLPAIEVDANVSGVEEAVQVVDFLYERVVNADGTESFFVVRVTAEGEEIVDEITSSVENADGTYTVQVEAENGVTYEAVLAQDGTVISTNYVDIIPRLNGSELGGTTGGNMLGILGAAGFDLSGAEPITQTVNIETTGTEAITEARDAINELENKSITVSVDVESGEIGGLFDLLRQIEGAGAATIRVNVEADTSQLDSALAVFGLGDGGGGGAAGFTAPTIRINVTADVAQAQEQIAGLMLAVAFTEDISIGVTADASAATENLEALTLAAGGVPTQVTVNVNALGTGASQRGLEGVTTAAQAVPTQVSTNVSAPGAGASTSALDGVTAAAEGIPDSASVSVSVSGAGSAMSALLGVAAAAASIPASVSTTVTTNRVTNNVQTFSTIGGAASSFFRHGGIPQFANGGVVSLAEAGTEVLHFASGGTLPIFDQGYYAVPSGTYVEPANSVGSGGPGMTINNHFHEPIYGVDKLQEAVEDATIAAMGALATDVARRNEAIGVLRR